MNPLLLFIISFLIPFLFFRIGFIIFPGAFKERVFGLSFGYNLHHLHLGFLLFFIAGVMVLLDTSKTSLLIVLGLGLGLIIDEFTCFTLMRSERKEELMVYRKSLKSTSILFLVLVLVIILSYYFLK